MSWFSQLFSGPPHDYAADQKATDDARAAQQAAADKATSDKAAADLATLRASVPGTAHASAANYLQGEGVDPNQYSSLIDQKISDIMNTVAPTDPNPGSYFANIGQTVSDAALANKRTQAQSAIQNEFQPDYSNTKVTAALTDPLVSSEYASQRGNADAIIQNMLKRGVVTSSGAQAAENNLDLQAPSVRNKLNTAGDNALATGKQSLDDVINGAMNTAGTLSLGQNFDPSQYGSDADTAFNSFVSRLGDTFKSQVPGNLFDTSGLAAIAGAGQGAANTKFNPQAAAGIIDPNATDPNAGDSQNTSNLPKQQPVF